MSDSDDDHNSPAEEEDDDDNEEEAGDDDDDDDEEEEDDSEFQQPAKGKKRPRGSGGKGTKKKGKKKARFDMSMYDDEAAEDGADEDDEEEGEERDRATEAELTEFEREGHERVRRRQEKANDMWNRSEADIAADIERKYRRTARPMGMGRPAQYDAEDEDGDYEERPRRGRGGAIVPEVAQQSLLPSVNDPKLFMVKVKTGKERQVVWQIMNKAMGVLRENQKFGVYSAVCTGAKGYVYLEGRTEVEVKTALEHIQFVYRNKVSIVPVPEMTSALVPKTKARPLKDGQFVRINRGVYKDDLAKVEWVLESGSKAVIKYIPRLDLSAGPEGGKSAGAAKANKAMQRPPQRFFHPEEVKSLVGVQVERRKFPSNNEWMDFYNGSFYQNGFVRKEVNVSTMIKATGVNPTIEELQKFRSRDGPGKDGMEGLSDDEDGAGAGGDKDKAGEGEDGAGSLGNKVAKATAEQLMAELAEAADKDESADGAGGSRGGLTLFAKDDVVLVTAGDLKDLMGRVVEIRQTMQEVMVRVQPLDAHIRDEIVEIEPKNLSKFMRVGAHARVIDGQYHGETGTIVDVRSKDGDSIAVLLTDSAKEVQVRVAQLQETMDVAQGMDSLAGYEIYDLVQYGATDFGLIVVVGREDFTVLSATGQQRTVKPEELRGKRNEQSNRSVALDAEQNQVRVGDVVNVVDGKFARQSGTVKAMHKYTLFLHSRMVQQHSGIFTARARSCVLGGNRRTTVPQQMSVTYMGQVGPTGAGSAAGGGGKNDRRNRHDELLNKTVKLVKGTFKGHMGVVTEATATHVRVELSTKMKKVYVERDKVKQVGDHLGGYDVASNPFTSQADPMVGILGDMMAPPTPFLTAATPLHGSQTPMHGSQTPLHGNQTPVHGSQTPLHGSMTPRHDGGATPLHGSRTPSYDSWRPGVGDTPAHMAASPEREWGDARDRERGGSSSGYGAGGSSRDYGSSSRPESERSASVSSSRADWRSEGGAGAGANGAGAESTRSSVSRDRDGGGAGGSSSYRGSSSSSSSPMPAAGLPVWAQDGAWVVVRGEQGVIISVNPYGGGYGGGYGTGATIKARMDGGRGEEREFAVDQVKPAMVQRGDRVRVVVGDERGKEGRVKNIDGKDVVCKLKNSINEFTVVDPSCVVKI